MQFIQRIWKDIKRGESIDLFITVLAAIVLGFLNIIGLVDASWIASLTLGVLALVAIAMLGNRYRLEAIGDKLCEGVSDVLLQEFPDIEADLSHASEIWLVGVSLSRTIKEYYGLIESRLRQGASIKALVAEPEPTVLTTIVQYAYRSIQPDQVESQIHMTLGSLCSLKSIAPHRLELYVFNLPALGGYAFNVDKPDGRIYVEYYGFKMPKSSLPKLVLCPEDGYWYEYFREQFRTMFSNARTWECQMDS